MVFSKTYFSFVKKGEYGPVCDYEKKFKMIGAGEMSQKFCSYEIKPKEKNKIQNI